MNDNNKYGFTLVELLAVIVILAIILVIAVPQIMLVIEDTKKSTLESTAIMIAKQAEKAYIENKTLGLNDEITCESVSKISKNEYELCVIEFDNENNALVTIKGSGKYANLNVCEGDKKSATASNQSCEVSYGNTSAYIEKLEAFTSDNGLFIDNTTDKNIRYRGSNPNNYVYFNCDDKDNNNVIYGEENYDYANSCEVWRIIGVFDVDDGSGNVEKRVKLVRDFFKDTDGNTLKMSWDSSSDHINYGNGINQWGESTYEGGTFYEGADLMRTLNTYYIRTTNKCTHCNEWGKENCTNDCTSNIKALSISAINMVDNALWSTRGLDWIVYSAKELYEEEKTSVNTGKICEGTTYEGGIYCTDTVNRTTDWIGKIGLIYPSDWIYANITGNCENVIDSEGICYQENWLYKEENYWTISPLAFGYYSNNSWMTNKRADNHKAHMAFGVRPSLYLKSSVKIVSGSGTEASPYRLL